MTIMDDLRELYDRHKRTAEPKAKDTTQPDGDWAASIEDIVRGMIEARVGRELDVQTTEFIELSPQVVCIMVTVNAHDYPHADGKVTDELAQAIRRVVGAPVHIVLARIAGHFIAE